LRSNDTCPVRPAEAGQDDRPVQVAMSRAVVVSAFRRTVCGLVAFAGILAVASGQAVRPAVVGILHDEAGRPVVHADIQACTASVCFPSETGADGRFHFDLQLQTPVRVFLKTPEQVTTAPRRATLMWPVDVAKPARLDVGALVVPSLPAGVPLPAGSGREVVSIGDGLELSLIAPDLKASPGHALMNLAARRLAAARISAFPLPAGERIVAVYALHPFGAISDSPIGVRAPSTLAAGTPVKFWAIGELDGGLLAPVSGRATGQHVATAPGTGITVLTYLLVSR
jgi:hypothetical protein